MAKRKRQPASLRAAMEACLLHARQRHNRSVDNVADLMGLPSKWSCYKWMENGRLPAILIRPFEAACGATFVTAYLAASAHQLLVNVPTGRKVSGEDIADLHSSFAHAVEALANFYTGKTDADDTLARLVEHMKLVAFHQGNVERFQQPELDFAESEEEGA